MVRESIETKELTEQEKNFCDRLYQMLKNQVLEKSRSDNAVNAAFLDNNSSHKHKSVNHGNGGKNNGKDDQ